MNDMVKQHAAEFLSKLEELEEEYGVFVGVDVEEHWDYDIDDNMYLAYSEAFVALEDADGNVLMRIDY